MGPYCNFDRANLFIGNDGKRGAVVRFREHTTPTEKYEKENKAR
jgi:hypothetical protein